MATSPAKLMTKSKPDPFSTEGLSRKELFSAAVDLLSRRDYSRRELWRKLSPKAASAEDLESVLSELSERHWQSDERFGASYLRSRSSRGVGPVRLRQELQQKGLDSELTSELMETCPNDWFETAFAAARKKRSTLADDDPKLSEKLYRFLAYRGFTGDVIRKVIEQFGTEPD